LVAALGIAVWWQLFQVRPVGGGPAGPHVDAGAFARTWDARPVLLVGLGDSVTAGFGAAPGRSYFDRLLRNCPDDPAEIEGANLMKVFPNLRATNLSVSGSISPQHLRMQIPKISAQPSNVLGIVVMTTGGNDIIHNYGKSKPVEGAMYGAGFEQAKPWITNFGTRLDVMIQRIVEAFPGGCEIFLANIYDPTDGVGDIENAGLPAWLDGMRILAEYNRHISELAKRHPQVHLVDIRSAFLGHGIHCRQFWREHFDRADPHYWYHVNLEDPNDRGYDALRRLFLNEMINVFSARTGPSPSQPRSTSVR
jgi:lysophospholipase L1-like esterase